MHTTRVGLLGASLVVLAAAVLRGQQGPALPLLKEHVDPKEFGVQDEVVTMISAGSFSEVLSWFTGSLGRYAFGYPYDNHFFANLDIPAGAVIDYIGLNSTTDTDSILGVALWQRDRYAGLTLLAGFSAPAHAAWATDFAGPLGIQITDHVDKELVLDLEQAPAPDNEFFAWVEVHWHRAVSPPPSVATFNDVPTSHPFFQYIEAIHAAGITAGCGGGNFCPDQPITRRQEATFLAKALGLHWPN
jgi:S-layer family protein